MQQTTEHKLRVQQISDKEAKAQRDKMHLRPPKGVRAKTVKATTVNKPGQASPPPRFAEDPIVAKSPPYYKIAAAVLVMVLLVMSELYPVIKAWLTARDDDDDAL